MKCRPATRRRYEELFKQGILAAFGAVRLDASVLAPTRAYVATLVARGVQARPHVSLVRTVLRAAFELGVLDKVPDMPALPKAGKKLPDAPREEHVQSLLTSTNGWLRTCIALGAYAGLRMGEARALECRDVDLIGDRIIVRRAFSDDEVLTPKSTNERVVPLHPALRAILVDAMRSKLPQARIVVTEKGTTPNRQHVLTRLKYVETKHGLREWSFHALRHFFISAMVRGGASIEAVRILAGHSKLDVTMKYIHAEAAELVAAVSLVNGNRVGTKKRIASK